jgi:hypothetical protein
VAYCYDLGRNMTMSFPEGVMKTRKGSVSPMLHRLELFVNSATRL